VKIKYNPGSQVLFSPVQNGYLMRVRSGEVFYIALLMIIILLAMFVLVALGMMISMDQSMVTERKGAIFNLVDEMMVQLHPLMVYLASIVDFLVGQFWKIFPS